MNTEVENVQSEEERQLFETALAASEQYRNFTTEQVTKIVTAVCTAAAEKAEFYAEWAVRDTGYGNVQDKILKKQIGSLGQLEAWDPADFIEPVIDREKKMISYPRPAGILVGLSPVTNPVSTVFYLTAHALMTRNALIICPHPGSKECSLDAIELVNRVAEENGAPKGVIQGLREISIPAVDSIMKNPNTSLILAIGGAAMVHAAYSSGNPALGVGAGNIPCYVHKTADPAVVGPTVVMSSSFDNSLPCTTESVVLADSEIADALKENMKAAGGYFVNSEEGQKLRDFCWPEGQMNPDILGKDATWLAEQSGFSTPEDTRSLVVEITEIGYHEPVSKEKLWPVLGFKTVTGGVDEAIQCGLDMLEMMGKGHSASVHTEDSTVIAKWGAAMPVCRVTVNVGNVTGAGGVGNSLPASLQLGTGFYSGSSTDRNCTPADLLQWTRVAYNDDSIMGDDIEEAVAATK